MVTEHVTVVEINTWKTVNNCERGNMAESFSSENLTANSVTWQLLEQSGFRFELREDVSTVQLRGLGLHPFLHPVICFCFTLRFSQSGK